MKKFTITLFALIVACTLFAQAPLAFNYQGIARDLAGTPLINKNIGLRIAIFQGDMNGTEVYKEIHSVSTNSTGLFNIFIGKGTAVIDSMEAIHWGDGPYFLKIEMDTNGGSNYQLVGTNQLLSVPYALYAENSGNQIKLLPPTAITKEASVMNMADVRLNGVVNGNGFKTDVVFEYDTIAQFKNSIRAIQDPVTGSADITVSAFLTGLVPNKTYYFRVKASNAVNTSYGETLTFSQNMGVPDEPITDVDGNEYQTVKIGNQIWMAENLRTTKYNDGTPIPFIEDGKAWAQLYYGAYCYYNNDTINERIYGKLYNWLAAVDNHKLCPTGWHIPSLNEFYTLAHFLGGNNVAGGKLKETGTLRWLAPNTGATNESGFTALPSGNRNYYGNYDNSLGYNTAFWSTYGTGTFGYTLTLKHNLEDAIYPGIGKLTGIPVRCIKD